MDVGEGVGHRQAGDPACYPEQLAEGLEPFAPQKLYYGANPRGVMREIRAYLVQSGEAYSPGGNAASSCSRTKCQAP